MFNAKQTSKLISYWLRHNPSEAELLVDDFGWVSVAHLIAALGRKNVEIDLESLIQLNNNFDKVRWEVDSKAAKIRATHGHSFPVLLQEEADQVPEILYHGTAIQSVAAIAAIGLKAMSRAYVHLSSTIEMARTVACRHGKPIIIEIDAQKLKESGWKFFHTSAHVWLTDEIPVAYLDFRPWFPLTIPGEGLLKELKREIGKRSAHFLYTELDQLEAVWKSSASDDVLFQNCKSGVCYAVHLTYTHSEEEMEGWPAIEKFQSFQDWVEHGLFHDQSAFYGF